MKLVASQSDPTSVVTGNNYPKIINDALARIQELAELNDNWDSYGAISPTKQAILGAVQLINDLLDETSPAPDIFPVPNGNLQLEWSCFGFNLEIEVESLGRCHVFCEKLDDGTHWEKTLTYDLTEVREVVIELTEKNNSTPLLSAV